jgi:hypothetical protein
LLEAAGIRFKHPGACFVWIDECNAPESVRNRIEADLFGFKLNTFAILQLKSKIVCAFVI